MAARNYAQRGQSDATRSRFPGSCSRTATAGLISLDSLAAAAALHAAACWYSNSVDQALRRRSSDRHDVCVCVYTGNDDGIIELWGLRRGRTPRSSNPNALNSLRMELEAVGRPAQNGG